MVIQEIFGVNSHIRAVADGFAAEGYAVIAPALFDRVEPDFETGYAQEDIDKGRATRGKIPWDTMMMDVRAAVNALGRAGHAVAVVGYCMGGSVAWLAATRVDGVSAAVGYYGGAVAEFAEEQPRCPVMLHFGETDASIPKEHYEKVMRVHPKIPVHIYPAGHGFNCDQRGSYHEPSARTARERTLAFLRTHL